MTMAGGGTVVDVGTGVDVGVGGGGSVGGGVALITGGSGVGLEQLVRKSTSARNKVSLESRVFICILLSVSS